MHFDFPGGANPAYSQKVYKHIWSIQQLYVVNSVTIYSVTQIINLDSLSWQYRPGFEPYLLIQVSVSQ